MEGREREREKKKERVAMHHMKQSHPGQFLEKEHLLFRAPYSRAKIFSPSSPLPPFPLCLESKFEPGCTFHPLCCFFSTGATCDWLLQDPCLRNVPISSPSFGRDGLN